jgi:hypothetical protein
MWHDKIVNTNMQTTSPLAQRNKIELKRNLDAKTA